MLRVIPPASLNITPCFVWTIHSARLLALPTTIATLALLLFVPAPPRAVFPMTTHTVQSQLDILGPEFEYWPSGWPVDPKDGWNWTDMRAPFSPGPYHPPIYGNAMPYTTRSGAQVTARFFGLGTVTFGGWAANGSRATIKVDNLTKTIQGDHKENLVVLTSAGLGWHNISITLEEGGLQIHNLTYYKAFLIHDMELKEAAETLQPTETPLMVGAQLNGYFNVSSTSDWVVMPLQPAGKLKCRLL